MKLTVYKAMSGKYRISDTYGLSEKVYNKFKRAGLPVYRSMGGSLNLRDSRGYTKEQILKIKEMIR